MYLSDILRHKGPDVHAIAPGDTLDEAAQTLVRHNIGSLVVCDEGHDCDPPLVGILTERDILRACAARPASLVAVRVREVMSTPVLTASPHDSVVSAMGLLTRRRIRHLPVVDGNRLVGMISIGDLVKAQHDELSMENHYLKSYIQS